jgi:LAO/AO transport system kinase
MRAALTMLRPASEHWRPPALKASAARGEGIADFWQGIEAHRTALDGAGELAAKRRHQAVAWMWQLIDSGLRARFRDSVREVLPELTRAVELGAMTPAAAAQRLLDLPGHAYDNLKFD